MIERVNSLKCSCAILPTEEVISLPVDLFLHGGYTMFNIFCLNLHDPHFLVEFDEFGPIFSTAVDAPAVVVDLGFIDLPYCVGDLPFELIDELAPFYETGPGLVSLVCLFPFQLSKVFGNGLDTHGCKGFKQFFDSDGLKQVLEGAYVSLILFCFSLEGCQSSIQFGRDIPSKVLLQHCGHSDQKILSLTRLDFVFSESGKNFLFVPLCFSGEDFKKDNKRVSQPSMCAYRGLLIQTAMKERVECTLQFLLGIFLDNSEFLCFRLRSDLQSHKGFVHHNPIVIVEDPVKQVNEVFNVNLHGPACEWPLHRQMPQHVVDIKVHHLCLLYISIQFISGFDQQLAINELFKSWQLRVLASLIITEGSIAEGICGRHESRGREAGLRVSSLGSAEQEDVGLRAVKFIVDPAAGLLDADGAPFLDRIRATDSVRSLLLGIFLQTSLGRMTWRYSQWSSVYLSEYSISSGQWGIQILTKLLQQQCLAWAQLI